MDNIIEIGTSDLGQHAVNAKNRQEAPGLKIQKRIQEVCQIQYTNPDGTSGGNFVAQKIQFSETCLLAPGHDIQSQLPQFSTADHIEAGYQYDPNTEDSMEEQGLDAVKTAMENPEETSIEPLPLERAVDKPAPYPLDALGNALGPAAEALYNVVQAPDGVCAQSILGFATHAVQGRANVVVDGRIYPLNNNFLSIASRSARKSEVDHKAGLVHREFQKKLLAEYHQDLDAYRDEAAVCKQEKGKITKDKKTTMAEKNEALAKLRETAPKPPFNPVLVFADPTVQGIHKMFEGGTPSKFLCADEGGQISGGHSMKSDAKTYSSAVYSKYWDGAPIPRVRGGDGVSFLDNVRLSMHLMMQDEVAAAFFNDRVLRNQGLLSRFLVSYPSSLVGRRDYSAEDVAGTQAMKAFYGRVREILSAPLPLRKDEQTEQSLNELEPRTIHLEEDAKSLWVEFYKAIEAASGKGCRFEPIEGFAGKAPNHMIRLAGVMALFDDIHRETIPKLYMENAITLVQYYLNERLRLASLGSLDHEIENAKILLSWIQRKDLQIVTLRDIYQSGPSSFRSKKQAEAVVKTLEDHRWLIKEESGAVSEISGNKNKAAWRVNHMEM